ncbi:hypothetical protein KMI_11g17410 [Encephalitozoon hellem]|nr:hypothetical protein KMI_11g17410 [Encephalitozoon hellem]
MDLCMICGCEVSIRHETPCGHSFCYLCIKRHLGTQDACPVCGRGPLRMEGLAGSGMPTGGRGDRIRKEEDPKILKGLCRLKKHIKEDRENE